MIIMSDIEIKIEKARFPRVNCPVSVIKDSEGDIMGNLWFKDEKNKRLLPGYAYQISENRYEIIVLIPYLGADCDLELVGHKNIPKGYQDFTFQPVELTDEGDGIYRIEKNGRLFSKLLTKTGIRPFLMPIIGPNYKSVTREYPLKEIEGGTTDHIHHRSLLTAWGDVNGYDNWSEHNNAGHQIVKKVNIAEAGPALAHFNLEILWTDDTGKQPLLDEERDIFIYNLLGSGESIIDFRIKFKASYDEICFNDTKEAGLVSIRVADSMRGKVGGKISNAKGKKGEMRCWGRKAAWCDYSGEVDGDIVGITAMDHPKNAGFPSRWHVREYGLMGANPWSQKCFKFILPEKSYTIPKNETLNLKYRIYVHSGDADSADIDRVYRNFKHI